MTTLEATRAATDITSGPASGAGSALDENVVLQVNHLKKYFPIERGFFRRNDGVVRAVDDVSFTIRQGETVSLVGESGCGKTTTARCVVRAMSPTSGEILYRTHTGEVVDLAAMSMEEIRPLRGGFQMVFQDPFSSLNPRMTVLDIVGEPLVINQVARGREVEERVLEVPDDSTGPFALIFRYGRHRPTIGPEPNRPAYPTDRGRCFHADPSSLRSRLTRRGRRVSIHRCHPQVCVRRALARPEPAFPQSDHGGRDLHCASTEH